MASSNGAEDNEASLERTRTALIARYAPGTTRRSICWSGGEAQVLELGEGSPLLLVHGGLGAATNWLPIFPALARDHRVLAPDRPAPGPPREPERRERLILVGAPAGTRRSAPLDMAMIRWPLVGRIVRWLLGRSTPA